MNPLAKDHPWPGVSGGPTAPPARPAPPEELDRLQRWLQTVITHPDGVEAGAGCAEAMRLIESGSQNLETVVTASKELSAAERLAIYGHAYYARLIECLGEVYPILQQALGKEVFDGFAFGYLQSYPSRSYTLNALGKDFPRYLDETRPASTGPESGAEVDWPRFLVDLGRLEWEIYEVFDGPGMESRPALSADDLLELPPSQWDDVCLRPAPCLRLLSTRFPVNAYFTAATRRGEGPEIPWGAPEPSFTAITRRDYVVRRYTLTQEEHSLLSSLVGGTPIGPAVGALAVSARMDEERLAARLNVWLRNWTAEGFFESFYFPDEAR